METQNQPGMKFPLEIRLRVIGHNTEDFPDFVLERLRQFFPYLKDEAIDWRPSHGGKYLAIHAALMAESQEQLDAIFRDLSAQKQVLYII